MVNRIQTFEDFGRHWGLANLEEFKDFLDQRKEEGDVIFTQAHQTMGHKRLKIFLDDLSLRIVDITANLLFERVMQKLVLELMDRNYLEN